MDKSWEQYEKEYEAWNNRRKEIAKENEELIKEWRSIPWYAFWRQVPFELQRKIILGNWSTLGPGPRPPALLEFLNYGNTPE